MGQSRPDYGHHSGLRNVRVGVAEVFSGKHHPLERLVVFESLKRFGFDLTRIGGGEGFVRSGYIQHVGQQQRLVFGRFVRCGDPLYVHVERFGRIGGIVGGRDFGQFVGSGHSLDIQ